MALSTADTLVMVTDPTKWLLLNRRQLKCVQRYGIWLGPRTNQYCRRVSCVVRPPPNSNPDRNVKWSRLPPKSNGFFRGPYATFLSNFVKIGKVFFSGKNEQTINNADENVTSLADVIDVVADSSNLKKILK